MLVQLVGIMSMLVVATSAWSPRPAVVLSSPYHGASSAGVSRWGTNREIDVSDLGLTMDDFNAPLPKEFFQVAETSGYESTSKIPSVKDDACFWTETPTDISVILAIPGLRGQPPMAMSVLTSTNTISVSVFGRIVWSAILRGETLPHTATFEAREGSDFIPIIEYTVQKAETGTSGNRRWDGFILQVGEDSLL
jgi:hypothetical protein